MQPRYVADAPDRLWITNVTAHPGADGKVHCAAVFDVSRRVVAGWPTADHMRAEPVVDALRVARWRRRPARSGRAQRPRIADRVQSVTDCAPLGCWARWAAWASSVDHGLMESFWSTMHRELLNPQRWDTKADLVSAVFE